MKNGLSSSTKTIDSGFQTQLHDISIEELQNAPIHNNDQENLSEQIERLKTQTHDLNQKISDLEDDREMERSDLENKIAALETRIKMLEKENFDLHDENEVLEQNLEDTFKEKIAAKDEVENLKKRLGQAEILKLKDENNNLIKEVEDQQNVINEQAHSLDELRLGRQK